MDTIILPEAVRNDLIAHARDEAPRECCGLLIGTEGRIDESVRARNLHRSRTRYLLDPADHIASNRRLRGTGRTVLGCYHSHPHSAAVPSGRDCAEALYDHFVWMIVSLASADGAQVAAFRIRDGSFEPVTIVRAA